DVAADEMAASAERFFAAAGTPCTWAWLPDAAAVAAACEAAGSKMHAIPLIAGDQRGLLTVENPTFTLVVATLQSFLDEYMRKHAAARIDYIHGDDTVTRLGGGRNVVGFYLPAISKHDLFRTIVRDGALPRKTFSMGEADEKRFYLEARRIT
ncbi:MAG: DUF1015 family protein, partial [Desulfuromonadales bacterium]|nr:DUF1015 family protein [Desulfuromonadales bacterium]